MVFKTRAECWALIKLTFIPELVRRHKVIRATRNGAFVGWMSQFMTK